MIKVSCIGGNAERQGEAYERVKSQALERFFEDRVKIGETVRFEYPRVGIWYNFLIQDEDQRKEDTYTLTISEIKEMIDFLTNRRADEVKILSWLANRK